MPIEAGAIAVLPTASEGPPPQRYAWIETTRTIACGLVVLMHVNALTRAGVGNWWPGGFLSVPFFCLAVPAFLVISGFLQSGATRAPSQRLVRLFIPFITWNIIMLVVVSDTPSLGEIAFNVASGVMHLYFLIVLIQLIFLDIILQRVFKQNRISNRVFVTAAVVSIVSYAMGDLLLWIQGAGNNVFEGEFRKLLFPWVGFYFFGRRARQCDEWLTWSRRKFTWLTVSLLLSYGMYAGGLLLQDAEFGYTPRIQLLFLGLPFQVIAAWLVLLLARYWENNSSGFLFGRLSELGRDTYAVYLAHYLVLIALMQAADRVGLVSGGITYVPLLWLTTLVVTYGGIEMIRRFGGQWVRLFLLGEMPAEAEGIALDINHF